MRKAIITTERILKEEEVPSYAEAIFKSYEELFKDLGAEFPLNEIDKGALVAGEEISFGMEYSDGTKTITKIKLVLLE